MTHLCLKKQCSNSAWHTIRAKKSAVFSNPDSVYTSWISVILQPGLFSLAACAELVLGVWLFQAHHFWAVLSSWGCLLALTQILQMHCQFVNLLSRKFWQVWAWRSNVKEIKKKKRKKENCQPFGADAWFLSLNHCAIYGGLCYAKDGRKYVWPCN